MYFRIFVKVVTSSCCLLFNPIYRLADSKQYVLFLSLEKIIDYTKFTVKRLVQIMFSIKVKTACCELRKLLRGRTGLLA